MLCDTTLRSGLPLEKNLKSSLDFRIRPFGVDSLYDVLVAVKEYKLGDLAAEIRCPMLVTNPDNETFWPVQSQQLYDSLTFD